MAASATFQPQNNRQAYLAYALGLSTALPEPRTIEEALLKALCTSGGGGGGGGGGTVLPDLTNPATREQILAGYQAIDGNGNVITGAMVSSAGVPIEVASEGEMEAALAGSAIGAVYKYTGETTDTFEQGALYIVEEAI